MVCFFNVQLKPEKCSGGNISKVRISGLAAANAAGKKLPIGKAKNPRCFENIQALPYRYRLQKNIQALPYRYRLQKNIQALPYRYRLQKKSWMDSVLFEGYVRELNAEFKAKEGKCALIIDNCPAHHAHLILNWFLSLPTQFQLPNWWVKVSLYFEGPLQKLPCESHSCSSRSKQAYSQNFVTKRVAVACFRMEWCQ